VSIDDVNRMALLNNFDIQVFRLDRDISEKELLKARAVYDTGLEASYTYNEDRLKRSSVILGSRVVDISQSGSLAKTLPTGTVLSLGVIHERQASDSAFSTLNPYHETAASVSITQPVGKNAWGIADRNTIKITELDIENAGYTSLDKIEQELGEVQKAYWNLLLATNEVDLTQEILQGARNLFTTNKKNYEIGLVEPPEHYAVDANLKEKQRDVLLAQDILNRALNRLRLKLNIAHDVVVVPKDDFFTYEEVADTFEELLQTALRNRRDYEQAKNEIKAMDLELAMKKNALWPEIDLTATLTRNGLDRNFRASVREITSQNYPEYTVGVTFSVPLENSTARAEYSQAELEKAKALVSLKKVECLILVQVHDAYVHAKSLFEAAQLLQLAADLQNKKYTGEEDRFSKGRSDTDRLIRYQNDYLVTKLRYLVSLYNYRAALIDLQHSMNTLLIVTK
jgi:outer membrane protein TolC